MFDFIGVTSPAPAGCMVEFTLYGDSRRYVERAENIAWHLTDQTEGRVEHYHVLSGGEGWCGLNEGPIAQDAQFLHADGHVGSRGYRAGTCVIGWRPYAAPAAGPDDGQRTVLRGKRGLELIAAELTLLRLNYSYEGGEEWQPPPSKAAPTRAPALLDQARCHMEDRAATYDHPEGERSMGKTVEAFNVIAGRDLSESEGWLLMQILKDVRDRQRIEPHRDSLEDGIAYAALKAEARLAGR